MSGSPGGMANSLTQASQKATMAFVTTGGDSDRRRQARASARADPIRGNECVTGIAQASAVIWKRCVDGIRNLRIPGDAFKP
jgi:hypothetical protein